MSTSDAYEDRLITRSQIGLLAGVARPTVTSWGRDPDFPDPERTGEVEHFHQAEVISWLDTRSIPPRLRDASELEGSTYGDRARRALDTRESIGKPDDVAAATVTELDEQHNSLDQRRISELLGDLADRVRGAGSDVDYMNLLLCLHFLRSAEGPQWVGVLRQVSVGRGSDGARALLDHIGTATDERLKHLGMVPGMREALLHLEPRTYDDLRHVVKRVGHLGRGAFRSILDEYQMRAGLRSGEFFTPRGVVRIMTGMAHAACDGKALRAIYDPYARGGELLAEAAAVCAAEGQDPTGLDVRGYSHGRDTARLASMHLALTGVRPKVRLSHRAPWGLSGGASRAPRFGLILTNPPFNMNDSAGEARVQGRWAYGPPPVGNDNFAYVQHVLDSLDEAGSAAVVMPNKAGNSANPAEVKIRRNMMERGVVKCAIALPDRLFSSTSVPVSVWILVSPARRCDEVLFLDARGLGTKRKGKRVLHEEDVRAVLHAYRAHTPPPEAEPDGRAGDRGVLSSVVSLEALLTGDHSLTPTDHMRAERSNRATVDRAFAGARHKVKVLRRDMDSADAAVTTEDPWLDQPGSSGRRTATLSEICEIKAGPSYTLLGTQHRTPDGQVPLVFPKDLKGGRIEDTVDRRVPAPLAERLTAFRLEAGDIVCIRSGAMGPPALVRNREIGWLMSTNLLRLRVREEFPADPEYLVAYLCRPDAVAWVRDRATATGAPSISAKALGNQSVVLPPYAEQRRIVSALDLLEAQAAAHLQFAAAVSDVRDAMAERLMGDGPAPNDPTSSIAPGLDRYTS